MMILVKAINEEVSFLKKKEAVFIGALLVISVVLCIFVYAVPHGTHGSIQITVDGELYGTYSLAEDQVIQIGDTNVCEIKDGEVKMTEADCPDHLCMGIPGMKLGLANLAVLFVLERYTWKEAALVSIVRIFIIGFMFGSGSSIMYSLAGATLSLIVMVFVKNKIGFGQLGVSVAGGVSHNIGQLLVAIPATHTVGLLYYYAPALMVSGVITGLLIGVLTKEVLKRIP